jgi:hypothetical protein
MIILPFRRWWSKKMTDITKLTIAEALNALKNKEFTAT